MRKTLLTMISLSFWIAVSAQIDTISTNIYQNGGNLGIGIEIPAHSLQIKDSIDTGVERNLLFINNLSSDSSSYTGMILKTGESNFQSVIQDYGINYFASPYNDFGGFLKLSNNSKGLMLHANSSNGIIKFHTGNDAISGAGIERMRIDSAGNVGIGTDSPKNYLTIEGDETGWPGRIFFSIKNKSAGSNSLAYMAAEAGTSGNHSVFGYISETYTANDSPEELQDYGWVSSNGNGLIICASKNNRKPGIIKFLSGQSYGTTFDERMRIDSTGNVGIGTKQPYTKLEIADGDIFISDIEKGIIMKSPDGGCWRGTLDNSGILNFVSIQCPDNSIVPGKSQEVILTQSVIISPNPAKDKLNIEVKNNYDKVEYFVYNTSGKLVHSGYIRNDSKTIDISALERGVYVFEFKDLENNKIAVQKIIKD